MRLLLFFDLPRFSSEEMKGANSFRKSLLKEGFLMLQESVYCKLALNNSVMESVKNKICKTMPASGNVMMLTITEKQFSMMEIFCDSKKNGTIDSTDRMVII